MSIRVKQLELKLLLLVVLAIFFAALSTASANPKSDIPTGNSKILKRILDHFQPTLLRDELYRTGRVDAGDRQGMMTRAQLENGELVIVRYGNKKKAGGYFTYASWPSSQIKRYINEAFEDAGGEDNLSDAQKAKIERRMRKRMGYSLGEQRAKAKELGKTVDQIKNAFPTKLNVQADELEALLITESYLDRPFKGRSYKDIPYGGVYKFHDIFLDQDDYHRMMPDDFKYSHMLTKNEIKSRRGVRVRRGQSLFYAHLMLDNTLVKYSVLNESRRGTKTITLKQGTKVELPYVVVAWELYEKFDPFHKKYNEEEEFVSEGIFVMNGYLLLEPYIERDASGNDVVSQSRVIGTYHTYTHPDPDYKDLSGVDKWFRLSIGSKVITKMTAQFRKKLKNGR